MESLRPLLGRTLVLVAHPDDEAMGCGILLQRMSDPMVIFATDGAPRSDYFWKSYGSREKYARLRTREAEQALAAVGVTHFHSLRESMPIVDQELYLHLEQAYTALAQTIETEIPDAILTHAYEGGHPDHDACCFLASVVAKRYELPLWEFPLYHRVGGNMNTQAFVDPDGEVMLNPTAEEHERKQRMLAAYASQGQVTSVFTDEKERFRPMRDYSFAHPPHLGELNYEAWRWPMTGSELCRAFTEFLQHQSEPARKREWRTVA